MKMKSFLTCYCLSWKLNNLNRIETFFDSKYSLKYPYLYLFRSKNENIDILTFVLKEYMELPKGRKCWSSTSIFIYSVSHKFSCFDSSEMSGNSENVLQHWISFSRTCLWIIEQFSVLEGRNILVAITFNLLWRKWISTMCVALLQFSFNVKVHCRRRALCPAILHDERGI